VRFSSYLTTHTNWFTAKDQLQLLLRNALQIVSVLKATFSATDFDHPDIVKGCDNPSSDANLLACKWKNATREIMEYQRSGENVLPCLTALFEVSMSWNLSYNKYAYPLQVL
jgi:ethanolamine phosphate transferase 2 subunit G